jgi:hypothetical protein
MGFPVLDLLGFNWQLLYQDSRVRDAGRIEAFTLPIVFHSTILAVGTSSMSAQPNWYRGGWLVRRMNLPGVGVGIPSRDQFNLEADNRLIPVNRTVLVHYPRDLPDFHLRFQPVSWLRDISIAVWEYTGPISDSTDDLVETLKVDIARVEAKIDRL